MAHRCLFSSIYGMGALGLTITRVRPLNPVNKCDDPPSSGFMFTIFIPLLFMIRHFLQLNHYFFMVRPPFSRTPFSQLHQNFSQLKHHFSQLNHHFRSKPQFFTAILMLTHMGDGIPNSRAKMSMNARTNGCCMTLPEQSYWLKIINHLKCVIFLLLEIMSTPNQFWGSIGAPSKRT